MQGEQPIGSPVETVLAALRGAGDLIGVELRLLRAELASKAALLGSAVVIVATGASLLFAATFILLEGIVLVLVEFGVEPYVSYFAAAALAGISGAVAIRAGLTRLRNWSLAPDRTWDQVARVFNAGKGGADVG